jgi:hypothetical protein
VTKISKSSTADSCIGVVDQLSRYNSFLQRTEGNQYTHIVKNADEFLITRQFKWQTS